MNYFIAVYSLCTDQKLQEINGCDIAYDGEQQLPLTTSDSASLNNCPIFLALLAKG